MRNVRAILGRQHRDRLDARAERAMPVRELELRAPDRRNRNMSEPISLLSACREHLLLSGTARCITPTLAVLSWIGSTTRTRAGDWRMVWPSA